MGKAGEIPQPLHNYFTSSKCLRNSRPGNVFSLSDLHYAPLKDIIFIFQYVVNDTTEHPSESWVSTEEMFISIIRKTGACWEGEEGGGTEEIALLALKGQASVSLPACLFCVSLGKSTWVIISKSVRINKIFYDNEITSTSSRKENKGFSLKIQDNL